MAELAKLGRTTTRVSVIDREVAVGFDRANLGRAARTELTALCYHLTLLQAETADRRGSAVAKTYRSPRFVVEPETASGAQRADTVQSLAELSPNDLSTATVRVDYQGESEKSPAIIFTVKGTPMDWKRLRAVPGLEISDWESKYTTLSFTVLRPDGDALARVLYCSVRIINRSCKVRRVFTRYE